LWQQGQGAGGVAGGGKMEGQTNEIFGNLLNLNSNASSDWNKVEGKAEGQERT